MNTEKIKQRANRFWDNYKHRFSDLKPSEVEVLKETFLAAYYGGYLRGRADKAMED